MNIGFKEIENLLTQIDQNLNSNVTICLIGSGATILLGQQSRSTEDLDVWKEASLLSDEFKTAVQNCGLSYNPTDEYPITPYLQVVQPGIVRVPGWNQDTRQWLGESEKIVWQGKFLKVTTPPAKIIIASKLLRGDDQDEQDCIWLMINHQVEYQEILDVLDLLPSNVRQRAVENLETITYIGRRY